MDLLLLRIGFTILTIILAIASYIRLPHRCLLFFAITSVFNFTARLLITLGLIAPKTIFYELLFTIGAVMSFIALLSIYLLLRDLGRRDPESLHS